MRLVLGVLVLAAACGDDGNMFPVGGGGNDGGFTFPDSSGTPVDAAVSDSTIGSDSAVIPVDAALLMGRVCLLTDPRIQVGCAATGAGGLTVRIGNAAAVTGDDGTFFIEAQTGTLWRVTGPNIVSSYMVVQDYQIPAISTAAFTAMRTANGTATSVTIEDGEGSLMLYTSRDGSGHAGVSAESDPLAAYLPFYDGATAGTWNRAATDTNGAVWIPGFDVGTVSVTVTDGNGTEVTRSGLPIFDGGITFVDVIFP